jgi:hypothetical protein
VPEPSGGAAVLARWNAPFDIWEDPDSILTVIDGFLLERAIVDEDPLRFVPVLAELTREQRVTDRDVLPGLVYAYRVSSVTGAGVTSLPTDLAFIQVQDRPPAPPQDVRYLVETTPQGDPFVRLFWNHPSGVIPDAYLVSREPGIPAVTVSDTFFVDVTVAWGNDYLYRVSSVVNGGESAPIAVPISVISPPTNLRGTVEKDGVGVWGVLLAWDPPVGTVVSHYDFYRVPLWPDGSIYRVWVPSVYEDREVEEFLTYRYWAVAVDFLGRKSPPSNVGEFLIGP